MLLRFLPMAGVDELLQHQPVQVVLVMLGGLVVFAVVLAIGLLAVRRLGLSRELPPELADEPPMPPLTSRDHRERASAAARAQAQRHTRWGQVATARRAAEYTKALDAALTQCPDAEAVKQARTVAAQAAIQAQAAYEAALPLRDDPTPSATEGLAKHAASAEAALKNAQQAELALGDGRAERRRLLLLALALVVATALAAFSLWMQKQIPSSLPGGPGQDMPSR